MVNINEIKMDRDAKPVTSPLEKKILHADQTKTEEGVTVSTHLSQLVNLMETAGEAPSNSAVADVKQKIQAGEYSVDYNVLSDKLLRTGVLSGT